MAGETSVSVDCFIVLDKLDIDTTNNHPALTSYFANPSFKNAILLEILLSSRKNDNVSIVTSAFATMFEPTIFVRRGSGTHQQ